MGIVSVEERKRIHRSEGQEDLIMRSDRYRSMLGHGRELRLCPVKFCLARGSWMRSDVGRFLVFLDEEVDGRTGEEPLPIGLEASPVIASTDVDEE